MSGDGDSKGAVLAALVVNAIITVLKFIGFAVSGSGSMFAEAMHTLADTGNQALLFIGIKRSERPANEMFSYGYGGERFLFALLSAVGIFVLGCGVTVYHGVEALLHPNPLKIGWLDFVILGVGFCLDGFVLLKAVKAINARRGDKSLLKFLRTTDDPTIAAVLLEDSVACFGVILALTGILLSYFTRMPIFDAIGSIFIGGLLGFIAVWLGYKNRGLMLGRAIPPQMQQQALDFLNAQPSVDRVRHIQSRIIGADTYTLKAEIDWNGHWYGEQQLDWVHKHEVDLHDHEAAKKFSTEFGERITNAIAREVDRLEDELQKMIPELKFLDFEGDAPTGHTQVLTPPKP
ncbi:MAG: cation diffusion facilitator family transporter [Planctomycetes bacterium]|nr:cation diffusion facilitator family transporter [Planctomycetota bacterium]